MGRVVLDGRRRQALVFGLMVVGVVLALTCLNAQAELVRRRRAACDGSMPLPTTAYVLGGIGLFVGLLALVLLLRWFGHSRQLIAFILFATAVAGVIFQIFVLITAIQADTSVTPVCGSRLPG
ncbi:hypothetical protein GCM10009789_64850 [Kribbella sancticallisti]|uniref:Vitamin K epoxide reductase family protein n=1 Tax=Kribbella sancticallisti TaxID=460087 RepID=A0ABN2ECB8_9ACTN